MIESGIGEFAALMDEAAEIGGFDGWVGAELVKCSRHGITPTVPPDIPPIPVRYYAHRETAAAYVAAYRDGFTDFIEDCGKY